MILTTYACSRAPPPAIALPADNYTQGCQRRLDPLLTYHAWVRKTLPTGISNDAMGSEPRHPFFLRVIENLQGYKRNWFVPYITVMYNTGPLFLSVVWKEYLPTVTSEEARVRILMPEEYNSKPHSFFGIYKGSSWHRDDAKAIFWMGQHWLLVTIIGIISAPVLYAVGFFFYQKINQSGDNTKYKPHTPQAGFWPWSRNGYKRIVKHDV